MVKIPFLKEHVYPTTDVNSFERWLLWWSIERAGPVMATFSNHSANNGADKNVHF